MGKLFYIMGKSASGKDTIYQRLLRNPEFSLERLVIYTTRPIRDGELDGREYHFVTEEDFQKLKAEGKIIEDRGYETVYGLWRYFTADNMNIEVEDGERLKRAIAREETQETPKYEEMCRRFLADAQDFSEEKIRQAGISHRFSNMDGAGGYSEIEKYLRSVL